MFHVLNLQTLTWSKWRKKDFASYDDFGSQFVQKWGHLYVFGGFKNGRKCNELYYIDMANKTQNMLSEDSSDATQDSLRPCQRSGTRMVADEQTKQLYLFGGSDCENVTLNDLWVYSIKEKKWTKIEQSGQIPKGRAGHSMNLYQGKIFIFGGLLEVTKESSELFVFDI